MLQLIRMLLILGCLLPASIRAEEVSPQSRDNMTEAQKEELFRKPGKDEPMFPFEEMISKPVKNNESFFSEMLNMLSTLGIIVGLVLIAVWFIRRLLNARLDQMNESSAIRILERRNLSHKSMIYLIEVHSRHIVLAESHHGIIKVAEFPGKITDTP